MATAAALPYEEPSITTILILASFLLLLNAINHVLDRLIFCGLVGQIFIGVAWGLPGANWLSLDVQHAVTQLGYLGLILIVYEGGLSTSFSALRANLFLSVLVALTGIAAPIALSFVLLKLLDITSLQAFAAGAALCSTSLGTTFTILSTSGLADSRLGVILSSAAMLDDVVGLVMVQVITSLGASGGDFQAATVARPIGVSLAFAVLVPVFCRLVVIPLVNQWRMWSQGRTEQHLALRLVRNKNVLFVWHTLVLAAFVASSSYAGTSNLFAAYLAGAYTSWFDSLNTEELPVRRKSAGSDMIELQEISPVGDQSRAAAPEPVPSSSTSSTRPDTIPKHEKTDKHPLTGSKIYSNCYAPAVETILKPFFFASIGFSIPIRLMFSSAIVWRGIVYTVLMLLGKLLCGLWLVRYTVPPFPSNISPSKLLERLVKKQQISSGETSTSKTAERPETTISSTSPTPTSTTSSQDQYPAPSSSSAPETLSVQANHSRKTTKSSPPSSSSPTKIANNKQKTKRKTSPAIPRPKSLYPPLMLGSAMVARGEIGFLIASLAESTGIFSSSTSSTSSTGTDSDTGSTSSELFLVVTWAILLCTIIGPLAMGLMVKRVRRLQETERVSGRRTGREDPLGVWGVVA